MITPPNKGAAGIVDETFPPPPHKDFISEFEEDLPSNTETGFLLGVEDTVSLKHREQKDKRTRKIMKTKLACAAGFLISRVLCFLHQKGTAEAVSSYSFIRRNRPFSYCRYWAGTSLMCMGSRSF